MLLDIAPMSVAINPDLMIGPAIVCAQSGAPPSGNIAGIIVMRECWETDVFTDIAVDFIIEAAEILSLRFDDYGLDGQITDWYLMPNRRDVYLKERTNGRVRLSGGAN